jgi:mono/diheme cytochrome c family protein
MTTRPSAGRRRIAQTLCLCAVAALACLDVAARGGNRWYEPRHAAAGAPLYARNCSACHGEDGAGAPQWQRRGADGYYPAPPLNGTGHAWHHPLNQLYAMIHDGNPAGQGRMPAWGGRMSRGEILAVIAWFQSWWPDEIYRAWERMDQASQRGDQGL